MNQDLISIAGVDVGNSGAFFCITLLSGKIYKTTYFKFDKLSQQPLEYFNQIKKIVDDIQSRSSIKSIVIEVPFAVQRQGNVLAYGKKFGWLEMSLSLISQKKLEYYHPRKWQGLLYKQDKNKKAKQQSKEIFEQFFQPTKHLGIIDAGCIALAFCFEHQLLKKEQ